ncbi:hypothetical protein IWW48_004504 [Coemansia sp. RSA 1200]|nr:hypothetical protein IWW48_004504 [Coemansia sp. RSA 1200]
MDQVIAGDITAGLLVRTDPTTAAVAAVAAAAAAGINVSTGALLTTAQTFASNSPGVGGTTPTPSISIPTVQIDHQQQQQQEQQEQQMRASLFSKLSASMHFCSSCKKRMAFDAFRRRKNGGLYSTCMSCLERTKVRKSVQRYRGGGAAAATERHTLPVVSQGAIHCQQNQQQQKKQQQPQGTGATTAATITSIGASKPATSLCANPYDNCEQYVSSGSPPQGRFY